MIMIIRDDNDNDIDIDIDIDIDNDNNMLDLNWDRYYYFEI